MYIGRFVREGEVFYGNVEHEAVYKIDGDIYQDHNITDEKYLLDDLTLLPPSSPSKIILAGLNYKDHASELGLEIPDEPVLFLKPSTSIITHNESIIYPSISQQVDYEAELAFIINKTVCQVKKEEAYDCILGYTCFNDVTARDLQKRDGQWTRAKSFDTFSPFGPYIYIPNHDFDPHNLKVQAKLNDEVKQDSSTENLIFKIDYLIEFISQVMTLYPGDVISTGTPPGIGPMKKGDTIEISIEKVGSLINKVE